MSFRARLALVAAAAVALAVVAASFAVYFIVRNQLLNPIDESLRQTAEQIQHSPPTRPFACCSTQSNLGGAPAYAQLLPAGGAPQRAPGAPGASHPRPMREVASGETKTFLRDAHVRDTHVRMITFPLEAVPCRSSGR
jgi:two-component system sensor histidine kinase MprB